MNLCIYLFTYIPISISSLPQVGPLVWREGDTQGSLPLIREEGKKEGRSCERRGTWRREDIDIGM